MRSWFSRSHEAKSTSTSSEKQDATKDSTTQQEVPALTTAVQGFNMQNFIIDEYTSEQALKGSSQALSGQQDAARASTTQQEAPAPMIADLEKSDEEPLSEAVVKFEQLRGEVLSKIYEWKTKPNRFACLPDNFPNEEIKVAIEKKMEKAIDRAIQSGIYNVDKQQRTLEYYKNQIALLESLKSIIDTQFEAYTKLRIEGLSGVDNSGNVNDIESKLAKRKKTQPEERKVAEHVVVKRGLRPVVRSSKSETSNNMDPELAAKLKQRLEKTDK